MVVFGEQKFINKKKCSVKNNQACPKSKIEYYSLKKIAGLLDFDPFDWLKSHSLNRSTLHFSTTLL